MITSSPSPEMDGRPGLHSSEGTRLHGRRLVLARIIWITLVAFTLSIFIVSLPAYFAQLQTICTGVNCIFVYGQLTPGAAQELQHLGLSVSGYAASTLALAIVSALVFFGVAGVLFWRKSDDWMAMLVSLFLVTFGVNFIAQAQGISATKVQAVWYWSFNILIGLGYISLCFLLYLFPDGRFVPRWTRLVAVFAVASNLVLDLSPVPISTFPGWILSAIFLIDGSSGLVAQIYRYVRVSGPVQRQQTKWVVFGLSATMLVILGRYIPPLIFPSLSSSTSLYFFVSTYAYPLGLLLIPLSLGIAVLHYRLWDIDILINRTLIYGTLTVSLALIYAGLIIGLQALLGTIITQNNDVAIVVSTLAIYALFQPLRRSIQNLIDRRFYRRKYDASRTLAAFNATLRHEVDLDQLREQLVAVVQETMQPASVSLWLRPAEKKRMLDTHL